MRLRSESEPSVRLTPAEARAFLEVHAEHEAGDRLGTSDAPTLEELAEFLRLPPEEAASILREARARLATPPVAPARLAIVPLLTAGLALVIGVAVVVGTMGARRVSPAIVTVPAAQLSPAPPPPLEASVDAIVPPMTLEPPAGFWIEVETPAGNLQTSAVENPQVRDFSRVDAFEAANLRARLVRSAVSLMASGTPEEGLPGVRQLTVVVRVQGGGETHLLVPIEPFTPPLRNDPEGQRQIQAALTRVVEAAWPQIVRPSPR